MLFHITSEIRVTAGGRVEITTSITPTLGMLAACVSLARVGVMLKLPSGFDNVEWFGRGPFECYQDRKVFEFCRMLFFSWLEYTVQQMTDTAHLLVVCRPRPDRGLVFVMHHNGRGYLTRIAVLRRIYRGATGPTFMKREGAGRGPVASSRGLNRLALYRSQRGIWLSMMGAIGIYSLQDDGSHLLSLVPFYSRP